jgi:hypothetical protein
MQIPILNGSFTDENSDFRTSYPRNMIPVPKKQGISNGYLRPAYGINSLGTGSGVDRAAINWNDVCYRVSGTKLIQVATDGTTTVLGDVGGSGQSHMDYSFDRLSIQSSGNFYYWDGTTLAQITDADLGTVLSHIWVDGYFMTTDGEYLVVTELTDPTQVNPLKYGSSEVDPDPIKAVLKVRNEPHAVNRYTIEVFYNRQDATGTEFPFQRNEGAQITRGAVGTFACCVYEDTVAFVGGGRDESIGVYLGANGTSVKLSTREIEQVLDGYTETQLSQVVCESISHESHKFLYVHLPDRTMVYDAAGSASVQQPVWFELGSGLNEHDLYKCRNMVRCYGKWIVGDPESSSIGVLTSSTSSHWGSDVAWMFQTGIIYNESRGAIINELELVALTGRVALGEDPTLWTSHSEDGETWSMPRFVNVGKQGARKNRIRIMTGGMLRDWRIQRVTGNSDCHASFARLEARLEALAY